MATRTAKQYTQKLVYSLVALWRWVSYFLRWLIPEIRFALRAASALLLAPQAFRLKSSRVLLPLESRSGPLARTKDVSAGGQADPHAGDPPHVRHAPQKGGAAGVVALHDGCAEVVPAAVVALPAGAVEASLGVLSGLPGPRGALESAHRAFPTRRGPPVYSVHARVLLAGRPQNCGRCRRLARWAGGAAASSSSTHGVLVRRLTEDR